MKHKIIVISFAVLIMLGLGLSYSVLADKPRVVTIVSKFGDKQLEKQQPTINPFMKKYQETENAILIDIRTPEEYNSGHIKDAINIDFYSATFVEDLKRTAGDQEVFLYCRSGGRSGYAKTVLESSGLSVYELPGGILSYQGELVKD